MNDITNNDNREEQEIQQNEEFQNSGDNAGIPQPSEADDATQSVANTEEEQEEEVFIPTETTEIVEIIEQEEQEEKIETIEVFKNKKEEEIEEVQQLHTKHASPQIPVIDHRILAGKLTVYDWLGDLPQTNCAPEVVEVRFKNTRKAFFSNPSELKLQAGDIVAVEAALGHDIGVISLSGELVKEQIRLKRIDLERNPLKKVYRKAKPHDIEKWQQAIALEHETMIRSRKIAADLKLNMKIGDVEYQGDKTKAIFYYIAEDRVDFRTLIKVLAETFRIRIEMKQIGTRQEAGRIGGIGPCGLKLCCSTFITNFISVSTSAARYQDISLNPQKLAGQCGKLKCCLNYEADAYIDAQKDFPSTNLPLNTGDGMMYHQKTDIFGQMMSYAFDKEGKGIFIQIPVKRVKEIILMNRKGIIPPKAIEITGNEPVDIKYTDGVGEESLNRFDDKRQRNRNPKNRSNNGGNRNNGNNRNTSPLNEKSNNQGNRNNAIPGKEESENQVERPDNSENKGNAGRPERNDNGNASSNGNNGQQNNRNNQRPNSGRDQRRDQRRDQKPRPQNGERPIPRPERPNQKPERPEQNNEQKSE